MINDNSGIIENQVRAAEETKFAKEKQASIKLVLGIGITSSAIIGTVTAFYTSLILAAVVSALILAITAAVCLYISRRKFQPEEETVRRILPSPSNEPEEEDIRNADVLLNELSNLPPNELAGLAHLADIVQRLKDYSREDNNGINCNININTDLLLLPIGNALTSAVLMNRDKYMLELSYEFYDRRIIAGPSTKRGSINVVKSIHSILISSQLLVIELFVPLLQACLSERHASENFKQIILNELPQTTQRCFETLCKHVNMNPLRDFSRLSELQQERCGNRVLDQIRNQFEEAAREQDRIR